VIEASPAPDAHEQEELMDTFRDSENELAQDPSGHDPSGHDPSVDGIPQTGDPAIDEVVAELARARTRPLADHISAGEQAHRVLQARLSDLGGE
jgi:hypothetical protein